MSIDLNCYENFKEIEYYLNEENKVEDKESEHEEENEENEEKEKEDDNMGGALASDEDEEEEEKGVCCFCGFECNPASQSCGTCAREVSGYSIGIRRTPPSYKKEFLDFLDSSRRN